MTSAQKHPSTHLFVPTQVAERSERRAVTDFTRLPLFLSPAKTKQRQGHAGVPDNVRELRGQSPSRALALRPRFFFSFFLSFACSRVKVWLCSPLPLLTRSGCGVGLVHLALCVCLENTWFLKKKKKSEKRNNQVRKELLKPALCERNSGETASC